MNSQSMVWRLTWKMLLQHIIQTCCRPAGFSTGLVGTRPRKAKRRWLERNAMWKTLTVNLVPSPAVWMQGWPELLPEIKSGGPRGSCGWRPVCCSQYQTIPWLWFGKQGIQWRSTSEAYHGSEYCRLNVLPNGRRWRCLQGTLLLIHKEQSISGHGEGDV